MYIKKKSTLKHGGKRGRPRVLNKRIQYNIRLKPYMLKWLRTHPDPAIRLIETALENTFPEIKGLK